MNAERAEPPRPRVSVIVPARTEASKICGVVATLPHDLHEVLIVGGGSEEATVKAARELRPDVRTVRQGLARRRMRSRLLPLGRRATVPTGGPIASATWALPPIQISTSSAGLQRRPPVGEGMSSATGLSPQEAPRGTLPVPPAAGSRTSAWARG
jgi:hypothetical protein